MNVEYVRADVLKNVQQRLIETYGGLQGLRDEGGLESAVARPRNLAEYGEVTSLGALGAALTWGLVKNHPFADGNKRVGLAALVIFLNINGHALACSEVEETAMILGVADGRLTEPEWTSWVEQTIQKQ